MPVHHFGGAKGSVFAFSGELDRWLQQGSTGPTGERAIVEEHRARSRQLTADADAMWRLCSERNLAAIVSRYRQAADEDPNNRAALTGLSCSLVTSALMGVVDGFVAYPSAAEALRRVPHDGSDNGDAQCAAAWLKTVFEHRWREARAGFNAVLKKNPANAFALAGLSLLHVAEGKLPEAFQCAWRAWTENPLAAPLSFLASWIQYLNRDFDDALELLADTKASGTYGAIHAALEGLTLTQAGALASNLDRIRSITADFPQSQVLEGILGYGYARAGHPGKAWEKLSNLMQNSKRKKRSSSYSFALILLGLGEKQEAAAWLERSFVEGSLWSLGLRSDPIFESLRGERHFDSLLRRLGTSGRIYDELDRNGSDSGVDSAEESLHENVGR